MSKLDIDKIHALLKHGAINDPAHLDNLKDSNNSSIRTHVASNPNCSQETLHHMATDDHPSVRSAVVGNPNTHKQTLTWMAQNDTHPNIRRLATNASLGI